jgi:hypothetical protein
MLIVLQKNLKDSHFHNEIDNTTKDETFVQIVRQIEKQKYT